LDDGSKNFAAPLVKAGVVSVHPFTGSAGPGRGSPEARRAGNQARAFDDLESAGPVAGVKSAIR